MKETLSQYVKRVMQQKGIGVREIERNSNNGITSSHISKVVTGVARNLTSDKVVALAAGLQVDPHEIFSVITGTSEKSERPDLMVFLDLMQKVAMNPLILEVLEELLRLEGRDLADMLAVLRALNKKDQKARKRKKS